MGLNLSMNLLSLKKKLLKYEIIIFDLDDTIYAQKNYDSPAILHVSKFISKNLNLNAASVFKRLRKLKKIRRGKPPLLLFNNFFKDVKIYNKNHIILKCISLFQNYECKELKKCKSLKLLIQNLYKNKTLFLVTNGNLKRQENKVKHLGIRKYFKKIFILDGLKKKTKPSIKDVMSLVKFININKNLKVVYVGDNAVSDKKFSENLKIDFILYQFPII